MKTGRKQRHHIAADGNPIVGLSKQPDGRWRVIGTSIRFSEPDEAKAIAKFRELKNPDIKAKYERPTNVLRDPGIFSSDTQWIELNRGFAVFHEKRFFAWIGEQIRTKPQWMAEQTGVERLAYLPLAKPQQPLPKPAELRSLFETHYKKSVEQKKKVLKAWDYFVEEIELKTLDEIDPELVVAFRDTLHEAYGPKTQSHVIGGIRRVFTLAKGRAVAVDAITRIQGYIAPELLHPSEETVVSNPKPVDVDDFHKLLDAAVDPQDRAMVLLMLNAALYVKEVIGLRWDEINNDCLLTRRNKTGRQLRAAVLWPETIEALNALPHNRDEIFVSYAGEALKQCGGHRRFMRIAKKAEVAVTGSQLRDGAYTEAVAANIQSQLSNIFVGHSSGMDDRYVLRNPKIVKPCCDAVYAAYFAKDKTGQKP